MRAISPPSRTGATFPFGLSGLHSVPLYWMRWDFYGTLVLQHVGISFVAFLGMCGLFRLLFGALGIHADKFCLTVLALSNDSSLQCVANTPTVPAAHSYTTLPGLLRS